MRNFTLLLAGVLPIMTGTTIPAALPAMEAHFSHVPNASLLVKLVLTIPALTIAFFSLPMGWLLDKWGRRPVLLGSLILFFLSGVSGFFLQSLTAILISRVLLGIAVAGIMPGFTALVGDYFEGAQVNKFMGLQATFMGFGGVLFLMLGGFLTDFGWRYTFLIYASSIIFIPLLLLFIPEPDHKALAQKAAQNPAKKSSLWRLVVCCGIALSSMIAFYMVPVQMPFILFEIKGIPGWKIGIGLATLTFVSSITSAFYKRLRLYFSFGAIFGWTFFLMGLGFVFLSQGRSYTALLGAMAVTGIGLGPLLPNMNSWVVSFTHQSIRGRSIGMVTSFLFLGQFLSPLAIFPLIQLGSLRSSFFWVGGVLLLTGLAISLWVWGRNKALRPVR